MVRTIMIVSDPSVVCKPVDAYIRSLDTRTKCRYERDTLLLNSRPGRALWILGGSSA